MNEKQGTNGTVTFHVFGMVDQMPTLLGGAEVRISPDGEPKITDGSGACTLELPEGYYTATATLELTTTPPVGRSAEGRRGQTRGGARTAASSGTERFTGEVPFHVCQGETREYPLEVDLTRSSLHIQFAKDPRDFLTVPASPPRLQYGQAMYVRVDWDGYESLSTDLGVRGAKIERVFGDKTGDVYSLTPVDSRLYLI